MPRASWRQCDRCRRPHIGPVCPCRLGELLEELVAATDTDSAPTHDTDRADAGDGIASAADVEELYRRYTG